MKNKKDNSTGRQKIALRRTMLRQVENPVVMETNGGWGHIWRECYRSIPRGVVFETDERKADILGLQRPTWAVYQADCVTAIRAGVGGHIAVNVLDVDPYGSPWDIIDAFFASKRPRPDPMFVVVNDGLRLNIKMGTAWRVGAMAEMVQRFGNDLNHRYLDVCQVMLTEKAALAGYRLDRFAGYHCGHAQQMTHYLAILRTDTSADRP